MNDYMIYRLGLKNGTATKPVKEIKPIPKRSERMKEEMKKYIPAVKEYMARPENKICRIQMEGCQKIAVAPHHKAGRIGAKLHDQENWVPSRASCNLRVETEDLLARELGFKKSRLIKKEKAQ